MRVPVLEKIVATAIWLKIVAEFLLKKNLKATTQNNSHSENYHSTLPVTNSTTFAMFIHIQMTNSRAAMNALVYTPE